MQFLGNLPALEAVLDELRQVGVDQIVVGGDVVPGPMPRETLRRLLDLDLPLHFIHGNGELAILALLSAPNEDAVSYCMPALTIHDRCGGSDRSDGCAAGSN